MGTSADIAIRYRGQTRPKETNSGTRQTSFDTEDFTPSIHSLTGSPHHHVVYIQIICDMLCSLAGEFPTFANDMAILIDDHRPVLEEGEIFRILPPESPPIELIVDLRRSDVKTVNFVRKLFHQVANSTRMEYRMMTEKSTSVSSYQWAMAEARIGGNDGQTTSWDDGLIPHHALPICMNEDREKKMADVLTEENQYLIKYELMNAIASFNEERWRTIAGHPNAVATILNADNMKESASLAVEMFKCFENAMPGITAARFGGLSDGQKSALLEAMAPVDRYLFVKTVGEDKKVRAPKP